MGKNNKTEAKTTEAPEPTIFEQLGIQPPKSARAREMAEHVLSKTVEYARQNGSCSTGTANFLIDTLNIEGITSSDLAARINVLGGVRLAVGFEIVTTPTQLANIGRLIDNAFVTYEDGKYVVPVGRKATDELLIQMSSRSRTAMADLLGSYTDYFPNVGTVHQFEVVGFELPEVTGSIK